MQSNVQVDVNNTIDTTGFGKGLEAVGAAISGQAEIDAAVSAETQKEIAVVEIAANAVLLQDALKKLAYIAIGGIIIYSTRNKWGKYL